MTRTVLTPQAPAPAGHYSQAIVHDDLIYVSGQLPVGIGGTRDATASFEAQCQLALSNIGAIVRAAGGDVSTLVKVTAYIVGVENWPVFNKVYSDFMKDHRPARTVVPVAELHYGFQVEIDAIAAVGNRGWKY